MANLRERADKLRRRISHASRVDVGTLVEQVRFAIAGSRAADRWSPTDRVYEPGKPAVLIRKERKSYLVEPVLEVTAASVTTARRHAFYLGADDAASLRGKTVAILDDVVSTGGTVRAIEQMLWHCGIKKSYILAVGTEGATHADVIALTHFEVFTC
jgi:hypothetical protein